MEGLVGLEELIGHSGRPARSGWQVAPATPLGPWGTLKAALGLLPSLSGGSSSIWAGGVWESIPVFRKKLTEENLFMEKMSVEGVIQSMPCAPCSLPWYHPHVQGAQTVPLLWACPTSLYLVYYSWGWLVIWYLKRYPWKKKITDRSQDHLVLHSQSSTLLR